MKISLCLRRFKILCHSEADVQRLCDTGIKTMKGIPNKTVVFNKRLVDQTSSRYNFEGKMRKAIF